MPITKKAKIDAVAGTKLDQPAHELPQPSVPVGALSTTPSESQNEHLADSDHVQDLKRQLAQASLHMLACLNITTKKIATYARHNTL